MNYVRIRRLLWDSLFFLQGKRIGADEKEKFHRVARNTIKRLLEGSLSVILIKYLSHGGAALSTDKISEIREMAISERVPAYDLCAGVVFGRSPWFTVSLLSR